MKISDISFVKYINTHARYKRARGEFLSRATLRDSISVYRGRACSQNHRHREQHGRAGKNSPKTSRSRQCSDKAGNTQVYVYINYLILSFNLTQV